MLNDFEAALQTEKMPARKRMKKLGSALFCKGEPRFGSKVDTEITDACFLNVHNLYAGYIYMNKGC